ncbi:MAG: hypothetical protein RLY12_61 [Verrucomicrobiota bacterium]|jgi:hypothetical protein
MSSQLHRRAFLGGLGFGLGATAFSRLLAASPVRPHFTPKAKSVIFVHLVGAPSQLDLYDYKPALQKLDRQPAPLSFFEGKRFSFLRGHPKLLGTPYAFKQHGQSGAWMSELLPHLAGVADDLTFIRSMHTKEFNHAPAQLLFHTGQNRPGYPGLGSWADYGLGSENQDLPSYVVFMTGNSPGAGSNLWGSGFLPSVHQGVEFRSSGEPVLFLDNPGGVDAARRRRVLDGVSALNQEKHGELKDPEILTKISQYEMAFRMQSSVPGLMDLKSEPESVRKLYGEGDFARQCLYARRLVESGVRFVELFNADWDSHASQDRRLRAGCKTVDQALAGLIRDLKQRGLLDQTLVVCAGEFGRTPMLQGNESAEGCGRDHHKDAFTIWMAGGGLKPGVQYGATDETGYHIAENPVEVRDVHATLFQQLGIDHEKLTFRYQGLDQRLTGVEPARIIKEIIA